MRLAYGPRTRAASSEPRVALIARLTLAVALAAWMPVTVGAQAPDAIVGRVTVAASGAPLAGAVVSAGPAVSATTDASGRYRLASLTAGTYIVRVRAVGYQPAAREVTVTAGAVAVADFSLEFLRTLSQVVVTGTRAEQEVGRIPAAVTVVSQRDVQEGRQTANIDESLRRVPGLALRVQTGGTTRATVSIRGAGAQSSFGARGVRILVDGIPKNNAGGSAQDFINIDLASVQRVEVVRGPSSALYGNQAGGVVNFITEEGSATPVREFRQWMGSFGFRKSHAKVGGLAGPLSYFVSAFRGQLDGWRQFSGFENTGFNSKLRYTFADGSNLTTVLAYDKLLQQIPGSLTEAEAQANPRQANPAFVPSGGIRGNIDELRAGVTFQKEFIGRDQLEVTGFYVPRPIYATTAGPIRNNQFFINRGASVRYLLGASLFGLTNRLTLGVDYHNTPLANSIFSRVNGAALQQLDENLTTAGAYAQNELSLTSGVLLNVGGRVDRISFAFEDVMRPGQPGSKFVRRFNRFTPKLGLVMRPSEGLSFYANYSEGFEAPVSEQIRNSPPPNGEFVLNRQLAPMLVRSIEAGVKGQPLQRLGLEVSVYRQSIDDFIVTRNFPRPGGTTYAASLNAARVRQLGVEVGSSLELSRMLSLALTYTLSDFVFDRFQTTTENFSRNRLAGIPRQDVFAELTFRHPSGLYVQSDVKAVSSFFLDDANTTRNPAYRVVGARAGHDGGVVRGIRVAPFIAGNNLTDEAYTSMAEINNGFRRYYNPMPGRNFVGGVTLGW